MGLFTSLLTLPLAPVRGAVWVAEQVTDEVDRQLNDPARLRAEFLRLELDHDAGLVDDDEYELRSTEFVQRLTAAQRPAWARVPDESSEEVDDG